MSNLLPILVASQSLGASDAGVVGSVLVVAALTNAVGQGLYGDIQFLRCRDAGVATVSQGALVPAVLTGSVGSVLLVLFLASVRQLDGYLLLVALSLPFLSLQDCARYRLLSLKRSAVLTGDAMWVVGTTICLIALPLSRDYIAFAWCVGGLLALLVNTCVWPVRPSMQHSRALLQADGARLLAFSVDSAVGQGAIQVPVLLMTAVGGVSLAQLAVFRLALSLFGPLNILLSASRIVYLKGSDRSRRLDVYVTLSAVTSVVYVGLCLLVLLALPRIFDSLRPDLVTVVAILGLQAVASSVCYATAADIRGRWAAREGLSARLRVGCAQAVLVLVGGAVAAARGMALGALLAALVGIGVWVRARRQLLAAGGASRSAVRVVDFG